ncbi:hypothetical protein Taro_002924 [Colocasia esculenta]|uniref:Protein kinase domain-containing protein n=1 Tax=Colocasia esculenta TaxID=4460 RepID=A0A843TQ97_COLES|nr:hypothetical protein [Colocasia esculenta]
MGEQAAQSSGRTTMARRPCQWGWWWCWSLLLLCPLFSSAQQLSQSQTRTLFRLQRILEYPPALAGWNNYTNLCYLSPSPSFSIACSGNRITELSVASAPGVPRLSLNFSIDSLFTTLSRLPSLTLLSLVSLGIWGPLPGKVDRFPDLRVLNLSSNYIAGAIPREISTMASLRSLVLADNRLNGTVPDLGPLPALEEVDLSSNRLGPEFPVLGKSVVTAVLRNNSFSDGIPAAVRQLAKLQSLDMSSNQLIGLIPPFLFSLPAIRQLDLSENVLAGSLPANLSCGAGLEFVDISGNRLVGTLPACIRANSSRLVVLDAWNCLTTADSRYQHRSSYCNEGAIAAVMPRASKKSSPFKNKLGFILGIVGGIAGAALVLGLVLILITKNRRRNNADTGDVSKPAAGKASSIHGSPGLPADPRHMSPAVRLGAIGILPYRVFTMEELDEATNNFDPSNLIQENSKRQMYKGWLQDGSAIIVRCLKLKPRYSSQSVAQFVDAISKLRHRHLVSVLGHCIDNDQENSSNSVYLVLEHVSNGTLRSHLTEWRKREMLKWPQRAAAVMGVARGIQFLHTVTVPGISGNDLNIENILLDVTLSAKIRNYNLPMLPKNKNNKIITGKSVLDQSELDAMKDQLQKSLASDPENLRELADPTILGTFAYDSLRTVVELALNCVSNDLGQRPSIDDVLWNLQYSIQIQDGWATSENLSTASYVTGSKM